MPAECVCRQLREGSLLLHLQGGGGRLIPRAEITWNMCAERFIPVTALLFISVALPAVRGQDSSEPDKSLLSSGNGAITMGGLRSVLEDAVSPAFGATIIIILTVIMSGSAYLCFLKYICNGCCKPMQVLPAADVDPSKVEEQV